MLSPYTQPRGIYETLVICMRLCHDPPPVFFLPPFILQNKASNARRQTSFPKVQLLVSDRIRAKAAPSCSVKPHSELVLLSLLGFRHPRVKHSALLGLEMPGRALWEEAKSTEIHSSLWLVDSQRGGKKKRKDCHLISTVNNRRNIYLLRFSSVSVLYFWIRVTTKLWKW